MTFPARYPGQVEWTGPYRYTDCQGMAGEYILLVDNLPRWWGYRPSVVGGR